MHHTHTHTCTLYHVSLIAVLGMNHHLNNVNDFSTHEETIFCLQPLQDFNSFLKQVYSYLTFVFLISRTPLCLTSSVCSSVVDSCHLSFFFSAELEKCQKFFFFLNINLGTVALCHIISKWKNNGMMIKIDEDKRDKDG